MNISLKLAKELAAVAEKKGYELPDTILAWRTQIIRGKVRTFTGEWNDDSRGSILNQIPAPNTNELLEVLPPVTLNNKYDGEFGDYVASINPSKTTGRRGASKNPSGCTL